MTFMRKILDFLNMDNWDGNSVLSRSLHVLKKLLFSIQTLLLFFPFMLICSTLVDSEGNRISSNEYITVCLASYVFIFFPINIVIRCRQANRYKMRLIEFLKMSNKHQKKEESRSSESYKIDKQVSEKKRTVSDAFLWECNSVAKSRTSEEKDYEYITLDNIEKSSSEPKWSSIRDEKEMEIERNTMDLKNVTIYFKDGIIVDVVPDVYDYYKAQFYNIDGKVYDSYSIESVKSIPEFDFSNRKLLGTPVYYLEYLLRIRASQERKIQNNDLAYALLIKSTNLMKKTGQHYNSEDFLRLSNWLYKDGQYEHAKRVEQELLATFPDTASLHLKVFQKALAECKEFDTDYIFCSSHQGACPICAKYQCRVYCISGKDPRFPKLPDIVYKYGGFHEGCRHNFFPHNLNKETIEDHNSRKYDAYEHSNRPFIDDRSDADKQYYIIHIEKMKKKEESLKNKEIYYFLMQKIPEVMPKSVAGFTKMKRTNSANYQKIVKAAHDAGIDI